jgi:hypothetical protein
MAEIKTKIVKGSMGAFIKGITDKEQQKDAKVLFKLMQDASGEKPNFWSNGMVGYGLYHYESERSSQKGDWPLTAFSVRKSNVTVYVMPGFGEYEPLLKKLGKFKKSGGSCLYIKKLADVDLSVLKKIVASSVKVMRKRYKVL